MIVLTATGIPTGIYGSVLHRHSTQKMTNLPPLLCMDFIANILHNWVVQEVWLSPQDKVTWLGELTHASQTTELQYLCNQLD